MSITNIRYIVGNLLKPGENLYHRVVVSGFWVFALRSTQVLFNFIRLVVLARLLSPYDFGLMGIALLTMLVLDTFSQTGFQKALIQKNEDISGYLDSAWTVSILRGFSLFMLLFLGAPYVGMFFNTPEAVLVVRVIGTSLLFKSLTNIGIVYFQKELEFDKRFVYEFLGTLIDFTVSILSALVLRNVWALVFGLLAGEVTRCFTSYIIHPYRPRLSFELNKVAELWRFGRWITGSGILVFLITQGDDIFVGKFLGATALGFYQMAYRISNMPATEITHVLSQITFPAYAKLQSNLSNLKKAYLEVLQTTSVFSFPIAGLIFAMSPDFVVVFLGEKWVSIVHPMQVLVLWGLIRSVGATTGPLFQATGFPQVGVKLQFAILVLLALLIYPLTMRLGILGTSLAVLLSALVINPVAIYKSAKIIHAGIWEVLRLILFPLFATVFMCVSLFTLKSFALFSVGIVSFTVYLFAGIALYICVIVVIKSLFNYDLLNLLRQCLTELGK